MEDLIREVTDEICVINGRGDFFRVTGILFFISIFLLIATSVYLMVKEKNPKVRRSTILGLLAPIFYSFLLYIPAPTILFTFSKIFLLGVIFVYGYQAFLGKSTNKRLWRIAFVISTFSVLYMIFKIILAGVCVDWSAGGYPFIDHWTQELRLF